MSDDVSAAGIEVSTRRAAATFCPGAGAGPVALIGEMTSCRVPERDAHGRMVPHAKSGIYTYTGRLLFGGLSC